MLYSSLPSITGDEAKVGAFVAAICRAMGLEVEVLEPAPGRPNVVATWDSGLPGPSLLLNDHLDMIPPGPLEYWTHPPFAAEIADGRVYGRGTTDTKSGVTTLLMAETAMRRLQIPIRDKITLLFVCDAEVDGAMGIQWFAQTGRLKADLAVVAERATKGHMNIGITTRGIAAETPGFDASMEQLLWWPGSLVEEDEPIVRIAVIAFEKVMGYRPAITGKDAGTDASWINALAGIPGVMFSPGNGKNAMNADENFVIDDLVNATKVIAQSACNDVGA